ncbi:MAG: hypothetical protein Faunusvirus4_30 [Faunusvirus sp.]|jgi:hypothetical protein|uniref:Uncharacterized protein n=1 Tax=Faunusvirus sp. TaxID=2487766 RepID=A0A3G5A122_9VIRU|nr:MAG: hypothetical protein Faunusvirus4_30 [Faunusvirus sp.]
MNTFHEKYWIFASYQSDISAAPFIITEHNGTYIAQMIRDMNFSFMADLSNVEREGKRFEIEICAISTAICPKYYDIATELKRSWDRVVKLPIYGIILGQDSASGTHTHNHDSDMVISTGIHTEKCKMVDQQIVLTDKTESDNTYFMVSNPQVVYKKTYLDELLI